MPRTDAVCLETGRHADNCQCRYTLRPVAPAEDPWAEAREQIIGALLNAPHGTRLTNRGTAAEYADAVLACPAVAEGLAAREAVKRVRAMHRPIDRGTGPQCEGCATHVTFTPWPCKTIRALGDHP